VLDVLAQFAAGARGRPVASSDSVRALSDHPEAMGRRSRPRRTRPQRHPPLPAPTSTATALPPPADPDRLLLDAIADGELDHSLSALADAIHARLHLLQTVRAATALAALCIGDEVRINHTVKPRYLHGVLGRIIDIEGQDVTVCLHRPVGRFTSGCIRCSALALERLSAAPATHAA
jgi:hypothetical protein